MNVFIVSASGGQNPQFLANFDVWGLPYQPPFTNEGQIWCAVADPWSTHTKSHLNVFVGSATGGQKKHFWANFDILGATSCTLAHCPFTDEGQILVCYSRPAVYGYVPNFVSIGLFCRPLLVKTPNFWRFSDFGI